jgi:hypothetical protein
VNLAADADALSAVHALAETLPNSPSPSPAQTKLREVVSFGSGAISSSIARINQRMKPSRESNTFSPMSASPGPSQTRTDDLSFSHEQSAYLDDEKGGDSLNMSGAVLPHHDVGALAMSMLKQNTGRMQEQAQALMLNTRKRQIEPALVK